MATVTGLIKKRTVLRAVTTKIIKEIREDDLNNNELQVKLKSLNKMEEDLRLLNDKIMDVMIEVPGNEDQCIAETERWLKMIHPLGLDIFDGECRKVGNKGDRILIILLLYIRLYYFIYLFYFIIINYLFIIINIIIFYIRYYRENKVRFLEDVSN